MDKDMIFRLKIHIVACVQVIVVCWMPAIVGDISVWNKLLCTVTFILLLRLHY